MDKALAFLKSISLKTWIIIAVVVIVIIIIIVWIKNSGTSSDEINVDTKKIIIPVSNTSVFPLKFGSQGGEVIVLQTYLKSKGKNLGTFGSNKDGIDGDWGSLTEAAVLSVFGKNIIDQATYNTIK